MKDVLIIHDYSDLISIDIDTIDLDSLTVTDADVVTMVDPFIFDGNDPNLQ